MGDVERPSDDAEDGRKREPAKASAALDRAGYEAVRRLQDELEQKYVEIQQASQGQPMVRQFLGAHVHSTLADLKRAYVQQFQILDDAPYRSWFHETAESLDEFADTFPKRSTTALVNKGATSFNSIVAFPGLAWLFGVSGLASLVSQYAANCWCHAVTILGVVGAPLWIVFTIVLPFQEKRRRFLASGAYETEDQLFDQLGRRRPRELQSDVLGFFILAAIVVTSYLLVRHDLKPWATKLFVVEMIGWSAVACIALAASVRRKSAW